VARARAGLGVGASCPHPQNGPGTGRSGRGGPQAASRTGDTWASVGAGARAVADGQPVAGGPCWDLRCRPLTGALWPPPPCHGGAPPSRDWPAEMGGSYHHRGGGPPVGSPAGTGVSAHRACRRKLNDPGCTVPLGMVSPSVSPPHPGYRVPTAGYMAPCDRSDVAIGGEFSRGAHEDMRREVLRLALVVRAAWAATAQNP